MFFRILEAELSSKDETENVLQNTLNLYRFMYKSEIKKLDIDEVLDSEHINEFMRLIFLKVKYGIYFLNLNDLGKAEEFMESALKYLKRLISLENG